MVIRLRTLAKEVTRVTLEVGSQGKLGGQAMVPDMLGVWEELTNNVRTFVFSHSTHTLIHSSYTHILTHILMHILITHTHLAYMRIRNRSIVCVSILQTKSVPSQL